MVSSVSDSQLVSMVKYNDGPTVWPDGLRNKYDPVVPDVLLPDDGIPDTH